MHEVAILGGGCFWCLEAVYQEVEGVLSVQSGYCGGTVPHPTYEQVCSKNTGHAEVVRVEFDPARVSYRELLEIFFVIHDPTTLNRQGNDVGSQYRSVIFTRNQEQAHIAQEMIAVVAQQWPDPVVTQVVPESGYYPAEDEHQNYYRRHPHQGYCVFVIAPKLETCRRNFTHKTRRPN
jgi:peptide-methionine (S)-S-oxide reductase